MVEKIIINRSKEAVLKAGYILSNVENQGYPSLPIVWSGVRNPDFQHFPQFEGSRVKNIESITIDF
jgi:hypothetical protein